MARQSAQQSVLPEKALTRSAGQPATQFPARRTAVTSTPSSKRPHRSPMPAPPPKLTSRSRTTNATPTFSPVRSSMLSTMASRARAKHQPFRFCDLPAELRKDIYERALTSAKPNRIVLALLCCSGGEIAVRYLDTPPGLLRTCQDMRNEALEIFYRRARFTFIIRADFVAPATTHHLFVAWL